MPQGVQVRNLALSGQQAPGKAPGVNFSTFNALSINAGGRVAMNATLAGPGVTATNRDTIWWDVPGVMQLVARTSEPAPGQPTFNYTSLGGGAPNLSDSGIMTYGAPIAHQPPAAATVCGRCRPRPPQPPWALHPPQGSNPAQWNGFSSPQINGNGTMAFRAIIASSAGSNNTHWIGTPNTLTLVCSRHLPDRSPAGRRLCRGLERVPHGGPGTFVFPLQPHRRGRHRQQQPGPLAPLPAGALSLPLPAPVARAPGLAAGALHFEHHRRS